MKDEKRILNKRQQNKKESAERKWKVIQEVQQLDKDGYNKSQISRKMNITRVSVNTYLLQNQPLERSTNSILDDYSNGLTEGFNNKTKVIKRVMYGRCSFNLLRIKMLA